MKSGRTVTETLTLGIDTYMDIELVTINRNIHVARVSRETRSIGYQGRVWD